MYPLTYEDRAEIARENDMYAQRAPMIRNHLRDREALPEGRFCGFCDKAIKTGTLCARCKKVAKKT